jgi:hypothetical protein
MQNKFNLSKLGLVELNQEESTAVDGGGWFEEFGYWVGYAVGNYSKNMGSNGNLGPWYGGVR